MDGCCHGENLNILLINRHKSYIVTADQIVSMTKNRACACSLYLYIHTHIHTHVQTLKKDRRQVNEKSFRLKKEEYRDGVKRRETRPGWRGRRCHNDDLMNP